MSRLFANKTVLVTGATGLIGSHVVDELMKMKDNVNVIALSRSEQKLRDGFAAYLGTPNFSYMVQDVSQPILVTNKTIDYIFHAAGPMEGKIIKNRPVDVISPNLIGTMHCLDLLTKQAKMTGVRGRLILFSSVTVYGNNTNIDLTVKEADTEITEALDSISAPYSQSKRMSEVIVQAYRKQYDIDVVIARFSTVYGNTRFIPDTAFFEFIRKAVNGENITLSRAGLPRRDNIYIDDAVRALLLVCEKGASGEAYNISSNGELGNFAAVDEIANEIADVVNDMFKRSIQIHYSTEYKGERGAGLKLDNSKLKGLGWHVNISLRQGIKKTINEYLAAAECV